MEERIVGQESSILKKRVKKVVLGSAVTLAVLGAGYHYLPSFNVVHKSTAWTREEPTNSCTDKGCTFSYTLCVPTIPFGNCELKSFNLAETYGSSTSFMPYPNRDHEFTTPQDLKTEADARADMIEGKYKQP